LHFHAPSLNLRATVPVSIETGRINVRNRDISLSGEAHERARISIRAEFVPGSEGAIETISVEPSQPVGCSPTVYFLVGWWGAASDYLKAMQAFAAMGFRCRSFSWRGTGGSDGWSFWGRGYEDELVRVIRHFSDERIVLIAHSGAIDYVRPALSVLQSHNGEQIVAAIFVAPLARSGAMGALLRWLKPDRSGTNLVRWLRFLGSNLFGVSWFMRNELALRRVLLSAEVSDDVVRNVWNQIDACPFGRYLLSLCRFPPFLQYRRKDLKDYGIRHSIVFHCELDRNFTPEQQRATAEALGAEFAILPRTCHQWFADRQSFEMTRRCIIAWLERKL
jgi:pimeloyl-ACP methyl ester carboxylesterase